MNNDAAYRAVVFDALRAVTVDDHRAHVDQIDLLNAVNRWAGRNGLGPIPLSPFTRIVRGAGYRHFKTDRRKYFAGLAIKEDAA